MPADLTAEEHDRLLRAVERITQMLAQSGLPRMAARVFAFVLVDDADRYTAAELAAGLRVSPAAVSGAVRYLVDVGLVFKEREPGTRADVYRVYDDDVWGTIMSARLPAMDRWLEALDAAVGDVGPARRGGQRLLETKEFYAFMRRETAEMMERWKEYRSTLH
jgi:DNA-binding transcriptional regulator GbsR (MarR family)